MFQPHPQLRDLPVVPMSALPFARAAADAIVKHPAPVGDGIVDCFGCFHMFNISGQLVTQCARLRQYAVSITAPGVD